MRRALLPAVLLALLLVPVAAAHLEGLPQGTIVRAGPYSVSFNPSPENPYENDSVGLTSEISVAATGLRARNVALAVAIAGPGGFSERREMVSDGTGYLISSFRPPRAGNYTFELSVTNRTSGEVHDATTSVRVFPELGFRLRSVDPNLDIVTGRTIPLAIEAVDPITLRRIHRFDDLVIVAEHWSNDHSRMLGSQTLATTNPSPGLFRADHAFPEPGMYHLRFSSPAGGFKPDDVPLLHAVATPGTTATTPQETPFPALLVLAAVALVAWARRG